jgi:hypothetical protein
MQLMNITSAVVFLCCFILYGMTGLPLPNGDLGMALLCTVVYALAVVWFWTCRRYPLAGWFVFGLFSGLFGLGRGGRRWW